MDGSFAPFSFLTNLQHDERLALNKIAHHALYKKRSYIFRADDLNDTLYVLLEGRVKITRLSQYGREMIQWFCMPGEIFGLSENKYNRQRGLYAQSIVATKLLCVQKKEFDQYIIDHPRVALFIIKQLTSRLCTLGDTLLNVTTDGVHLRFIKLIQRMKEFYGQKTNDGIYIDIYLTHQEMADMIGTCRQTVSSMVGELKRRGILDTSRNGICIQSPVELQRLTELPEMNIL